MQTFRGQFIDRSISKTLYLKKIQLMRNLISCLAVTAIVFTSCKKELEPQDSSPTTEIATAEALPPQPTTQTGNFLSSKPAMTAGGINPAHGQPGHRCDIAVGAPLNSPAATKQTAAVQTASPVVTTTAAPVKTAAGMNPPHGQTGHRCDIAVGAPLNSPPTGKAQTATTTISSDGVVSSGSNVKVTTTNNNATPAILNAPTVATAAGMNPPHGQEGHRCDIPVGAALPKS